MTHSVAIEEHVKHGVFKHALNSFNTKLSLLLIAFFILVASTFFIMTQNLTQEYRNEVEQKLHLQLAAHIVEGNQLLKNGAIDQVALKKAFHSMMVLGPSFEFYIIGPQGEVKTYSADPNKIKRQRVSLGPIKTILSGGQNLPILGDDPRSISRQKIFSVAAITDNDRLVGYLYIIIGGEIYDGIMDLLGKSHIVKLSLWGVASSLIFGLVVILLLFSLLTRPLRRLSDDMQDFRKNGFAQGSLPTTEWNHNSADEIHRLGATFSEMAHTLKMQYQKVKDIDELRRELISYVSHDLRTPLTSLQGYLETWQYNKDQLDDQEEEELIGIALKNAKQISRLVEQLFELAHLDGDNVQLDIEPVPIAELAQDVLQKLSIDAHRKNITLTIEPKDPSIRVKADIEKLERVFTNLVDNAVRHCNEGDQVSIELQVSDENVAISVRDTGVGIPDADLEHLFEPHFRASNSVKGKGVNSGLGLAITQRILQLHGTEIGVKSILGEGTEFCFQLARA
ncbi:MAG: two-component sensor histidine kinase [Moraxellaceae bacterium]|nr:MAG: two-component sensor histidine kinase [Moraxellaceae bacterium]